MESRCAVLFFDEVDALGQARGGFPGQVSSNSDPSARRILAEMLIQLNSVNNRHKQHGSLSEEKISDNDHSVSAESPSQDKAITSSSQPSSSSESSDSPRAVRIVVVAATNRLEDCDPALVRRFSVRARVDLPNAHDRRRMIQRFLSEIDQ